MKLRHFAFIGMFATTLVLNAQDKSVLQYGNLITEEDLRDNLSILASDALEGRETGTRGQKMAAAFIQYHFQQLGLIGPVQDSYFQPLNLYKNVPGESYISTGGTRFNNFDHVVYYGKDNSEGEVSVPVVFAGKGRPEDFQQINIEGKGVVIMTGTEDDYRSAVAIARSKKARMIFVVNTENAAEFKDYARQFEAYMEEGRPTLQKEEMKSSGTGMFFIAPEVAGKIFTTSRENLSAAAGSASKTALKKFKPGTVTYKTSMETKTIKTENVLGFLEGTDKKEEVIVITAHYDHIGKNRNGQGDLINNGADDDGSGTVAVLQLAKVFAQAKKDGKGPRRSILFMTVTGEESGLLGSEYYADHPVFPLSKTVVNLNIDMIGRRDEQHLDSPPYVYVIGADKLSSTLHDVNEAANKKYTNLLFDYTYNDQEHPARLYYRSDHWNFARKNIPIIFYFDGIHEDYHLPSDEVEKIEFDLLAARTQCVFYTAWEIANRDRRIMPDKK